MLSDTRRHLHADETHADSLRFASATARWRIWITLLHRICVVSVVLLTDLRQAFISFVDSIYSSHPPIGFL